jgi:hypothetical protein
MMQEKLEVGSNVFIIESNRIITEVMVSGRRGDFYTVRFPNQGGIQVRRSRLFLSREEAEAHLPEKPVKHSFRSPYDYEH